MERFIKLSAALMLALLLPAVAMAEDVYDFDVDGIYYKILENGNDVSVTYKTYRNISHIEYFESDYSGDITIPATVTFNGKTFQVTMIGDHAFYRNGSVTSITIPSSITVISWDAFYYCTGLTRVNITDMAAWCNMTCESSPLLFARHLYLNGTEVTDLVIPEGVTAIRNEAFSLCDGLTNVTIGNSVTTIGDNAFAGCMGLKSVSIGNSVTEIGGVAFEGCTNLVTVSLGNAVETIKNSAFSGCSSLKSIVIPNSVIEIGGGAFKNCASLASAVIGNSVTTISGSAFNGCSGLKSIDIPNSVTQIGMMAFKDCSSLASVTLGNSVASIGKQVFLNCPAIETVISKATTPPTWDGDLSLFTTNVYNHAPLHVPKGSDRAYIADQCWGQFLTIIGDVDEGTPVDADYLKCDVNGDGVVNIADVNKVIATILSH